MKKKRLLLVFFATLLCCGSLLAQVRRTITGTVTDADGNPIPGASVTEKNSSNGVAANEQGRFTIIVAGNAILEVSAAGFEPSEQKTGSSNEVTIVLKSVERAEDEVVVTALGIKRSPRSLGYATQTVSGSDLTIAQAPSLGPALYGKIAGLNISQAGGGVEGGSSRVVVRGNTKLTTDNRALIVVDGVPINNDPIGSLPNKNSLGLAEGADVASYQDWGTGLNFINPEDIENLTVLKGPAAAALYGSRGANGVILVTRKKGNKRKGLGVDYSFSERFVNVYKDAYNFQNEYGSGFVSSLWTANNDNKFPVVDGKRRQISLDNGYSFKTGDYQTSAYGYFPYDHTNLFYNVFSFPSGLSWGPKFDNKPILWYDGVERPYSAQPDNWRAFYPNGSTSQHNVSLSGGGDVGTVRFSYTRDDNKANVLNSKFNTNTFNIGSSIKISEKLSTEITASYINHNRLNTPSIGSSYQAGVMYAMPRDYNPDVERMNDFMPDGSRRDVTNASKFPAGSPRYPYYSSYVGNAFWNIYKNNSQFVHNQLIGGVRITADLTNWLTLTGQGGIDYAGDETEARIYPTDPGGTVDGKYTVIKTKTQTRDFIGMARFHKENIAEKEINASFTAGGESVYVNNYGITSNTNGNFINPFMFNLQNGASPVSTSDDGGRKAYKINSLLGIFDISYKNYLFLQVTGRNDWASTLRKGNNSFFYPAASVSYVFTDGISAFKESSWLSYGKIGLNYAGTGSGTDPYVTNDLISGTGYNGVVAQTYALSLNDPNIMPQRTKQIELNLNLGFFNNRLNLELSGYSQKSDPQIITTALPISSGVNTIRINNGAVSNKGIEFTLSATPIARQDFSWKLTLNGTRSNTKILRLTEGIDNLTLGSYFGGSGVSQRVELYNSYGTIYGKDFARTESGDKIIDTVKGSDGAYMSYTVNGKTTYLTKWRLTTTEVPIGNSQPKLVGGLSNTLSYKNISLYFLTDFKLGGDTYFGTYGALMGNGLNQQSTVERNGGGLPYVYPDGTTDNSGMIMDGVFVKTDASGKIISTAANTNVVAAPWYYASTYSSWNHFGVPRSTVVFKNSWMKLREVNLSYEIPQRLIAKTKVFQRLRASLIGRDLFYFFTTVPKGVNPEGVNGIGNMQGIEYSAMPNTRSLGFSIKASF
ncbi:MAG: SusC/RagA family TonB-linked outer membrane protein [Niabella sp.]|nr:SusC/RagA family TonB-linked outer membrane protein [Niabella sp.]